MAILPSVRSVSLALALALVMTLQIQLATTSSFDVTTRSSAPPVITIAPRPNTIARQNGKTTCDGGHGVFTCLFGSCYYDDTGAFACCNGTENCTAVQTCIPFGKEAGRKTCSKENGACVSCTDSRLPNCYTITNEGMSHSALFCANTGGFQVLYFTFDMGRMTEPALGPSTFVGAPIPISSAIATIVGPPAQPSSTVPTPSSTSTLAVPTPLSTSTSTLATNTDSPIETVSTVSTVSTLNIRSTFNTPSTVSAIMTVSRWMPAASQNPSSDDGHSHQLPGSTIGGIAVGAIAGACLLWGGLFFLYVQHKNRKLKRKGSVAGILPGPRRSADHNNTGGNGNVGSGIANAIDIPTDINELPGSGSTPRQSRQTANWCTDPPLPPKDIEIQSSPVSLFSQTSRVNVDTTTTPKITVSPTEPSPVDNRSSPFTYTNTSISSILPPVSPIFNQRPMSAVTTVVPETAEESMRKSSKMLPIAGPYLTAERALGDGFWEAEREQEEADRALLEKARLREDGTRKMSVGSPGDDAGMESETSTGTVIRRGVRNTIG